MKKLNTVSKTKIKYKKMISKKIACKCTSKTGM